MRENGLAEVHKTTNNTKDNRKGNTHAKGTKKVDAMMATDGVMQEMRGSKMTNYQDTTSTDHRGFMIDLGTKECFSIERSKCDQSDNVKLCSTKRSYRENLKTNWTNTLIN